MTFDITGERRANGVDVPLEDQIINGEQMRGLIADFLSLLGKAARDGFHGSSLLRKEYTKDPGKLVGLAFAALTDLCFNMEYVRRIASNNWVYCTAADADHPRLYYPYLGVCPHCIGMAKTPFDAAIGREGGRASRYFGNKIPPHYVGRVGERIITLLLDLLSRSSDPSSVTGLVTDDQHEIDAVFFVSDVAIVTQIKASPLILLPVAVQLESPLPSTGHHSFNTIDVEQTPMALYLPRLNRMVPLGPRSSLNWPYDSVRAALTPDLVEVLLGNWVDIYRSFEVPKTQRRGDDVRRAWLTTGGGDPIDDNKTKAGLARSDNMMKGTYACLKYGVHYVQPCERQTLRTALAANIDPAHQYEEYMAGIEDVQWAHRSDFGPGKSASGDTGSVLAVDDGSLMNLFDTVFTFNRQVINDEAIVAAWNLDDLARQIADGRLDSLLEEWRPA